MGQKIDVVTIDSGIPIPSSREKYPLSELKVGESFSFRTEKRASVQSAASLMKRTTAKEFRIRKIEDGICRVWRVK